MLLQSEPGATIAVDRVLLASPRSFCAGVEMAIKALAWMVRTFEPPVYCYHEIVHNRIVVDKFRRAGVVFVDDVAEVPAGAPLMLSAHGSAPEVVRAARARSDLVVDAVCPLVQKVHHEVKQRADKGEVVIYAGHRGHDESRATLAVSAPTTRLVETPADIAELADIDTDRPIAFLAQTTLGVGEWQDILTAARARFGDVWLPARSDLCFATTNRQAAIQVLAPRCDVVVVVGSANSSNTMALVRVAEAAALPTTRVVRVNHPDELPEDLSGTVGVTAGASAPEDVVQQVLARLAPRGGTEVVDVTPEDEYFPPPRELRELLRSLDADDVLEDDRRVAASDVLNGLAPWSPGTAAQQQLSAYSARVDEQMADVIETEVADPWLRNAIGYHLGWLDEQFEPLAASNGRPGGKKLRATLAILACSAAGGDLERALPFAAAVELIHNWSLVHDDIEDGDRTRRGRPALWTICGEAQAINVGDCIHALAFRCLARLGPRGVPQPLVADLMAELAHTAVMITVGQMRDLTFETVVEVDSEAYLEMIEGKTAALLRCATYGGVLVAGGDREAADTLGEFGRRLGLSFQIRDDILGIWGLDRETGKPTGADIRRRKKSLPVVLAFEHAEPADAERLREVYGRHEPMTSDDEELVLATLDGCGAEVHAQRHADQHRGAAVAALERVAAAPVPIEAMRAIADFVTERSY